MSAFAISLQYSNFSSPITSTPIYQRLLVGSKRRIRTTCRVELELTMTMWFKYICSQTTYNYLLCACSRSFCFCYLWWYSAGARWRFERASYVRSGVCLIYVRLSFIPFSEICPHLLLAYVQNELTRKFPDLLPHIQIQIIHFMIASAFCMMRFKI